MGVAAVSGVGEVEGRVPASVADGAWARATPWQVRKTTAEAIVFTTSYLGRTAFLSIRSRWKKPIGEKLLATQLTLSARARLRRATFAK